MMDGYHDAEEIRTNVEETLKASLLLNNLSSEETIRRLVRTCGAELPQSVEKILDNREMAAGQQGKLPPRSFP